MRNEERMLSGPVWRLFVGMSLPAILVVLVMVLYNMADLYFIGRTGDAAQVAAVSLAGPVYGLMQGLGTLLGSGGCTAAALALGRGDRRGLGAISSFCFWGALGMGLVLAVTGAAFAPEACVLLGARGDAAPYAARYVRILALGAPLIMLSSVLGNVVRADGSAKEAMLGNLLGTVLNIALDPLLIEALGMGVDGAALATVLGNAVGCAYLMRHVCRRQEFSLKPRAIVGQGRLCLNVLALGLPLAVSTLLGSCAGALGNGLLSRHGTAAVAAMGVAGKAGMLVGMVAMGVCMGIQPAISFSHGRGDARRALEIARKTALLNVVICTLLTAACFVGRQGFVTAFIDDPEVLNLGVAMLTASLTVCPLVGVYQLCTSLLQATGCAGRAILLSALRQGAVYIPCLYVAEWAAGLSGLIWAGPVADAVALVIAVAMALRQAKRMLRAAGEGACPAAPGR